MHAWCKTCRDFVQRKNHTHSSDSLISLTNKKDFALIIPYKVAESVDSHLQPSNSTHPPVLMASQLYYEHEQKPEQVDDEPSTSANPDAKFTFPLSFDQQSTTSRDSDDSTPPPKKMG